MKNKELLNQERMIQDLQRNMRELTDRQVISNSKCVCTHLLCNSPPCRLSEQAQRQLQDSEKFEDIQLGDSRATIVIQRYKELYTQARIEALDAIEAVQIKDTCYQQQQRVGMASTAAMDASDTFNVQLLLDIFKVCLCVCAHMQADFNT